MKLPNTKKGALFIPRLLGILVKAYPTRSQSVKFVEAAQRETAPRARGLLLIEGPK